MWKLAACATLAATIVLCAACGGEPGNRPLAVTGAEWQPGKEARVLVSGRWTRVISTPPRCILLEGRQTKVDGWYTPDSSASLDGNNFSKELRRGDEGAALDPGADYYVRCTVSMDSARTVADVTRVTGELPVGAR